MCTWFLRFYPFLSDCGVFGVSSDEYLNYALQNRKEWEDVGEQAVAEMIEKVQKVWANIEAKEGETELAETEENSDPSDS